MLGGSQAVSAAVLSELAASTGADVRRIAGPDRYATAARVAEEYFRDGTAAVFVATGEGFADALAGVPAAALTRSPLLLVGRDSVPHPTVAQLQRMEGARVLLLGRRAAISEAVREEIAAYAS